MHRAALLGLFLLTAGFAPGGEPLLVVQGKPVRGHVVATPAAPPSFAALAAQGWRAIWDRDTGAPLRISGTHIEVPGSIADAQVAERAARDFLIANLAVLAPGAQASDFVLSGNSVDHLGIRTVGFQQTAQGLRVIGGQLGFVFARDRLFVIGSEALPNVHVAMAPSKLDLARVESWVRAPAKATGERAILPLVRAGSIRYVLVDVTEASAQHGAWRVYVDPTGEPIARSSLRQYDAVLKLNAGVRYATGTRMDYPASELAITANGAPVTTGKDGTFAFAGASANIVPSLAGTRVNMITAQGTLATTSLTAASGGSATWNVMDDERPDAEVSTYVYGNLIKAKDRLINPSVAGWIDQSLDFYVNENDVCNAYSTGDDVHFFKKNSECENSGRIADIVFHEFGHSFHNHTVISGMGAFPGEMSEGFSDFNAANLTGDPGIGRGFDYTDNPGRDIDPVGSEASYPKDVSVDPHASGLIIAGALWDLRKAAILSLGNEAGIALAEKVFVGVMQRASDFPEAYNAALIVDDDDGDLGNGTPHGCLIAAAFAAHGMVDNFVTTSVGTPTVTGLSVSVPVTRPTNGTCTAPAVSKATLTWQVGTGAPQDVALSASANNYVGAIPAQPNNTVVSYSILIELENGAAFAFPDNQADPKYQLFVGTPTVIACANMDTDPMWTQTSNKGTPQWSWGQLAPTTTGTDPTAAFTGSHVLGNNLITGDYPSNLTSTIETPAFDVSGYDQVHLQFRRWLAVERGMYDTATVTINGVARWTNHMDLEHIDKEWRFVDLDVTGSASVKVGFTLASDDSQQYGGWTLDDVCLVGVKPQTCGNGVLESPETCDDGNTTDGDGCSATCTIEDTMGGGGDGGGCCSARRDPAGAALLALGLGLVLRKRKRRPALNSGC